MSDEDIDFEVTDDMLDEVANFDKDIKPVVVDIGAYTTKVGLAGDPKPIEERTMMVASTKTFSDGDHEAKRLTKLYGEAGIEAIRKSYQPDSKRRDTVNNVIHEDVSLSSGNLTGYLKEAIFHEKHIYERLGIEGKFVSSAHPVLMTDSIHSPLSHRSGVTELLFETFDTPSVYWELAGVLGLYAMGKQDGLVVDIGHSQTSVIPVVQGYCMDHAMRKVRVGGKQLDVYFNHLLRKAGITLHTNYWLQVVREIKEKMCRCHPEKAFEKLGDDGELNCEQYRMPDGNVLQIGNARKRACEILFGPHLLGLQCRGIQHQILDTVNDCELSLRRTLMSNVRLIGGTSMLTGLGRRLINELALCDYNRYEYEKMIESDAAETDALDVRASMYNVVATRPPNRKPPKIDKKTQVRLYAPATRKHSAWIGGSVLSSMDDFVESWITKKDYEEYGKSVVFRGVSWRESK